MYCPHCGRVMTVVDGRLTCEAGGMPLSRNLERTLAERFPVSKPRASAIVELGKRLTRWFCPGCGVPLDGEMTCGVCGHSIRDLLFPLVVFHPHSDV